MPSASAARCRPSRCGYLLHNRTEQEHRFIKHRVWAVLGFKRFTSSTSTLAGRKIVTMIRMGQFRSEMNPSQQFIQRSV